MITWSLVLNNVYRCASKLGKFDRGHMSKDRGTSRPVVPLRLLSGAAAIVAALTVVSVASATHPYDSIYPTANANWTCGSGGGTPTPGDVYCQTDGTSMSFWIGGHASTSEVGQIRSVLYHEYDDTVLNPFEVATAVWHAPGTGETDLILDEVEMDNYYPGLGVLGAAWCDDAIDSSVCDQHYAFLDNDVTPHHGGTGFTMNACHEIGHTVGLTHPVNAAPSQLNGDSRFRCMNQGIYSWTGPGDNNKHQIDLVYG